MKCRWFIQSMLAMIAQAKKTEYAGDLRGGLNRRQWTHICHNVVMNLWANVIMSNPESELSYWPAMRRRFETLPHRSATQKREWKVASVAFLKPDSRIQNNLSSYFVYFNFRSVLLAPTIIFGSFLLKKYTSVYLNKKLLSVTRNLSNQQQKFHEIPRE